MGKQAAAKSLQSAAAKASPKVRAKTAAKSTAKSKGGPKSTAKSKSISSRSTALGATNDDSKKQKTLTQTFKPAEVVHQSDEAMLALVALQNGQPGSNEGHQSIGNDMCSSLPSSGNNDNACSNTVNGQQLPADHDADDRTSANFNMFDPKTRRA